MPAIRRAPLFLVGIALGAVVTLRATHIPDASATAVRAYVDVSAQGSQAVAAGPGGMSPDQSRALLDRYCVTCHNERLKTAGLALDTLDVTNVPAGAESWEKVIRKLRAGVMPPVGRPRPDRSVG